MEINHFYPPIGLQHQCFTVTKHTKRHDYHVYNYNRGRFMEKNNKLMQKNIKYFFNSQFYPKNVVQPQCRGRSKMTLNTINECIIITHAHGFVPVKKYWGDGCLAAPYCPTLPWRLCRNNQQFILGAADIFITKPRAAAGRRAGERKSACSR